MSSTHNADSAPVADASKDASADADAAVTTISGKCAEPGAIWQDQTAAGSRSVEWVIDVAD